ncbi:MAG: hypothetical protein KAT05_11140 [Spirochaetes bacterium]|nr:hypothetical protein [Spirochaetota bacterium]
MKFNEINVEKVLKNYKKKEINEIKSAEFRNFFKIKYVNTLLKNMKKSGKIDGEKKSAINRAGRMQEQWHWKLPI